jgi:predicted nucleic acid-binding protein
VLKSLLRLPRKKKLLDRSVEAKIDDLWRVGSPIKMVEFFDLIAERARTLVRQGIEQGWGQLKPADAIHLATAQQMGATEFHTYDGRLLKWTGDAGFPVVQPHTAQGVIDWHGVAQGDN